MPTHESKVLMLFDPARALKRHAAESQGRAPLRASLLTTLAELEQVAPAYEALAGALHAPATMSWPVLRVWLETHPTDTPHVVLVQRGDEVVAAALLARRRDRAGTRLGKIGMPSEPFQLLHADEDAARALADAVVRVLPRCGFRLVLEDLPHPDLATDLLAARLRRPVTERAASVPVLDVSSGPRAGPTRNTRQAAAKARNRARREGHDLRLEWVSAASQVEAVLPALVRLHIRRNADLGREALLLDPVVRALFETTVRAEAQAGRVRLLLATIDDDLAAFALCLVSHRTWWVWANYADPAWLRYSPGTVTNAEVVRAAAADPEVDQLDWGSGVQRYKLSGPVRLLERQRLESATFTVALLLHLGGLTRALRHRLRRGRRQHR